MAAGRTEPVTPAGTVHHRGVVMPWECDDMGHMNVRFYLARYAQALRHRAAVTGLAGAGALRRRLDRVVFEHEARAGWPIACLISDAATDPGSLVARLVHSASGRVLARFESRLADAASRPAPDWMAPDAPTEFDTALGASERRPDPGADLAPTLAGWVSDANALAVAALARGSDYRLDASPIGFVVAELTLLYEEGAGAAPDAFDIGTVLLARSRRSLTLRHRIRDARDGTPLAAARVACVFFNRETRSAVPIPFGPAGSDPA